MTAVDPGPDVELLADLDAGLLDPERAAAVRAAALADPRSAAVLRALAATRAELGALDTPPVPPTAAAAWAAALAAADPPEPPPGPSPAAGAPPGAPLGAAPATGAPGVDGPHDAAPVTDALPHNSRTTDSPTTDAPATRSSATDSPAADARDRTGSPDAGPARLSGRRNLSPGRPPRTARVRPSPTRPGRAAGPRRRRRGALVAAGVLAVALAVGVALGTPPARPDVARVDLVAVARSTVGLDDLGPLTDPGRRAECLRRAGIGGEVAGGRTVRFEGVPGVLLVLTTGVRGAFRVVVLDDPCSRTLADTRLP